MVRLAVRSSMFISVGYDESTQTLEIEFKNGDVWQYSGVSIETYNAMMQSESNGKYFLSNIKGKYKENKI